MHLSDHQSATALLLIAATSSHTLPSFPSPSPQTPARIDAAHAGRTLPWSSSCPKQESHGQRDGCANASSRSGTMQIIEQNISLYPPQLIHDGPAQHLPDSLNVLPVLLVPRHHLFYTHRPVRNCLRPDPAYTSELGSHPLLE